MIGGGDGTTGSMLQVLNDNRIDFTCISIGVIPFGTGNDLSNALGWGGDIYITLYYFSVKKVIEICYKHYYYYHYYYYLFFRLFLNFVIIIEI